MSAFGHARQLTRSAIDNPGFHQSWFPVVLARELESGAVLGDTRGGVSRRRRNAGRAERLVPTSWRGSLDRRARQ